MTGSNSTPADKRHPSEITILDYDYPLPEERIAKYPLPVRDQSQLLVYKDAQIKTRQYFQLAEELPSDSLLVFNDTKVVEARLLFQKQTGSKIELFCLEPDSSYHDITSAMLQKQTVLWHCLVGGAKKWKSGALQITINEAGKQVELYAEKLEQLADSFLIRFHWSDPTLSFAEILHLAGQLPLPPYLNRATEQADLSTYQTVYAQHDGSVAAPTAGLHFTPDLFKSLEAKGISKAFLTLHVGAGTFKPVKADKMKDHEMHSEFMELPLAFLQQLHGQSLREQAKIIAVGTTSLRTLESLYWMGVKISLNLPSPYVIQQWDPYELQASLTLSESLTILITDLEKKGLSTLLTHTQIIIAPGYQLKVADAILTNFHQPRSTLLLLIASIVGDHWKEIYKYALENDYRFLSYGDGSLLWK